MEPAAVSAVRLSRALRAWREHGRKRASHTRDSVSHVKPVLSLSKGMWWVGVFDFWWCRREVRAPSLPCELTARFRSELKLTFVRDVGIQIGTPLGFRMTIPHHE